MGMFSATRLFFGIAKLGFIDIWAISRTLGVAGADLRRPILSSRKKPNPPRARPNPTHQPGRTSSSSHSNGPWGVFLPDIYISPDLGWTDFLVLRAGGGGGGGVLGLLRSWGWGFIRSVSRSRRWAGSALTGSGSRSRRRSRSPLIEIISKPSKGSSRNLGRRNPTPSRTLAEELNR